MEFALKDNNCERYIQNSLDNKIDLEKIITTIQKKVERLVMKAKMKKILEASNKHRLASEMHMQNIGLSNNIDQLPDDFIRSDRRFICYVDLEAVAATGGIIKDRRGQKLRLLLFNGAVLFTKIRSSGKKSDLEESFHPNLTVRRGTSFSAFSMVNLSRHPSMTNMPVKKQKALRFLSVSELSTFRAFEYIKAKGIFILTVRDAISYRLCVFRLTKQTTLKMATDFFNELIFWIGELDTSRREEELVELTEEDVKWVKCSSRRADFELIAKVMDDTPDLQADGTVCKKSLLTRTLSNISEGVAAGFRRLTHFAAPAHSISRFNSPNRRGDDTDDDV